MSKVIENFDFSNYKIADYNQISHIAYSTPENKSGYANCNQTVKEGIVINESSFLHNKKIIVIRDSERISQGRNKEPKYDIHVECYLLENPEVRFRNLIDLAKHYDFGVIGLNYEPIVN